MWVVAYQEIGQDSLHLRNARIDALVDVRYDLSPAVDLLVPALMRERYRDPGRNDVIEGTATYSRVRRFNVTSSEVVNEPAR